MILEVSVPDDEKDQRKSELRIRHWVDIIYKLQNDISEEQCDQI